MPRWFNQVITLCFHLPNFFSLHHFSFEILTWKPTWPQNYNYSGGCSTSKFMTFTIIPHSSNHIVIIQKNKIHCPQPNLSPFAPNTGILFSLPNIYCLLNFSLVFFLTWSDICPCKIVQNAMHSRIMVLRSRENKTLAFSQNWIEIVCKWSLHNHAHAPF
jgi:hypothetical protein